jgi:CRP/FNR family cyclic AMP-dependent transcriptional regulator
MAELESKRVFLIAMNNPKDSVKFEGLIKQHIQNTTIFTSGDGPDVLFKVDNVTPHVVILDANISKSNAFDITEKLIRNKNRIAVILVSPLPEPERFVNEVVTGQVHMLTRPHEHEFVQHLTRALNWITHGDNSKYRLCFLATDEVLIREGEKGESVYLVKRGQLKAYKNDGVVTVDLGMINSGEFVGEMAYINGEARSANVKSVTDCELIEIPNDCLDLVLFSKPAWSKALVKTLSSRLKKSNTEKILK